MKDRPCLWIGKLVKISLSTYGNQFNVLPIKITTGLFAEMDKLSLNLCSNSRGPPVAKTALKKNKAGRLTLPKFKIYCKATVNKCGLGIRTQTQWNRIKSP